MNKVTDRDLTAYRVGHDRFAELPQHTGVIRQRRKDIEARRRITALEFREQAIPVAPSERFEQIQSSGESHQPFSREERTQEADGDAEIFRPGTQGSGDRLHA